MDREKVLEEQVKFLREENAKLEASRQRMKMLIKQLFEELRFYVDPDDEKSLVNFFGQSYKSGNNGEVDL